MLVSCGSSTGTQLHVVCKTGVVLKPGQQGRTPCRWSVAYTAANRKCGVCICSHGSRGEASLIRSLTACLLHHPASTTQALCLAESDVRLLLSAASAAARDHTLGAEGILLVSKQGTSLMGNIASMISRLRALQDDLSTLRR